MSTAQHNHWEFTYNQWMFNENHYVDLIKFLDLNKIESYIDLGANTGGVCSVLLEKIRSLKKCYLFEPQSENFKYLESKFKSDSRIKCYNFGIYYTDLEFLNMLRCDNNVGGYTVIKHDQRFEETGDIMKVKKLEDFSEDFNLVDFVKIDVEGSEENIIENSIFLKNVKFIEIEWHGKYLDEKESVKFIKEKLSTHKINYDLSCFPTHTFVEKI